MWISFKCNFNYNKIRDMKINLDNVVCIKFFKSTIELETVDGQLAVITKKNNENFDKIVETLKSL